ncbi:MAG TPA: hypothetical protein VF637_12340 [Sphingomicrobium sp.]|jgi:hypothetical protein
MMIYKGGPQNYSKRDWLLIAGCFAAVTIAFLITGGISTSGGRKAGEPKASAEYREAAERAGYKGKEADEVGAAAERLCQSTGDC